MSALLIRNLPPEVHDRLKVLAQRNRRSLSEEAARLLEEAIAAQMPLAAQAAYTLYRRFSAQR